MRHVYPLVAGAMLACTPSASAPEQNLSEYCAIATRDGLSSWVGDVVTVCSEAPSAGDHDAPAACSIFRARGSELEPIVIEDARLAMPAFDGRLVVLTTDERLLFGAPGALHEIARWAAEPRVSEDGRSVAYVALADGIAEPELGAPTVIALHDLENDRREIVTDDPLASAPFPIPGTRDVLYVSTASGVASLWRSRTQITNLEMERAEQGFVPIPGRELAWVGSEAVFTASYEDDRIWRVDLATGASEELGPGAWPRASADGSIVARRDRSADCSVVYLGGRSP